MESAFGKISALDGQVATVLVDSPVVCKRCATGKGCGAGLFQGNDKPHEVHVNIPTDMTIRQGDSIELRIGPKFLLRAAALAYGLPLATMVLFPGLAWILTSNLGDGAGIVLALSGLTAGLGIGRQILKHESICEQFVPAVGEVSDGGIC